MNIEKYFLFISTIAFLFPVRLTGQITDSFSDSRDGQVYQTVQIGEQTWMAENMNYIIENSWCYDNNYNHCNTYGRLYYREAAKEVCPQGWRLPSGEDFEILLQNDGSSGSKAYHAHKDGGSSGFDACFGGWRSNTGEFLHIESYGFWWSSTEFNGHLVSYLNIDKDGRSITIYEDYEGEWGFSVRCIQEKN
jgi:uncharacterized protein (TIGR02145 family)